MDIDPATTEPATPIAIDPDDCGCTECQTGLYVPMNHPRAQAAITAYLNGYTDSLPSNNTGLVYALYLDFRGRPTIKEVRSHHSSGQRPVVELETRRFCDVTATTYNVFGESVVTELTGAPDEDDVTLFMP